MFLSKNICDSDCTSLLKSNNFITIRHAAQNKTNLLVKIFWKLDLAACAILTWLTLTVVNALEIVRMSSYQLEPVTKLNLATCAIAIWLTLTVANALEIVN